MKAKRNGEVMLIKVTRNMLKCLCTEAVHLILELMLEKLKCIDTLDNILCNILNVSSLWHFCVLFVEYHSRMSNNMYSFQHCQFNIQKLQSQVMVYPMCLWCLLADFAELADFDFLDDLCHLMDSTIKKTKLM